MMRCIKQRVALVAIMLVLAGCDQSSTTGSSATAGSASAAGESEAGGSTTANAPILVPFKGSWKFNLNKTLAYWQSKGVAANEIAQAKKVTQILSLHPDMNLSGDLAILLGPPPMEGQYQFYALHPHGQIVCGKAWHHEDRHDPGDMDKYLTRLELRGGDLYLSIRSHLDAADPKDPEVVTQPLLAGSAATCTADAEKDPPWSAWRTYIFDHGATNDGAK